MTVSTQFWGVDSKLARFFVLNADGSLKAASTAPFEPSVIDGTRNFDLTPAESGVVVNIGNGRVRDTIYRPPREASRAELRVGYDQLDVISALTGVLVKTIGEMRVVGRLTNRQGSEPDVAIMLTQRGHDENGLTRYKTYVIPKGKCVPADSSMNDNASEMRYPITISNSKKEIWGVQYTNGAYGFTEAGYLTWITEGMPHIVAWLADGVETEFLFPADKPAISAEKISVFDWQDGVEYTSQVTKETDKLTFDYPIPDGTLIVAVYEYEE